MMRPPGKHGESPKCANCLMAHKVLSHPHLMCTNNHKAEIKISEERLALDQGSGSTGGTTTQTRKWIPAAFER